MLGVIMQNGILLSAIMSIAIMASIITLCVVMLCVVKPSIILLSIFMLNVLCVVLYNAIIWSVIMPNVGAPIGLKGPSLLNLLRDEACLTSSLDRQTLFTFTKVRWRKRFQTNKNAGCIDTSNFRPNKNAPYIHASDFRLTKTHCAFTQAISEQHKRMVHWCKRFQNDINAWCIDASDFRTT